MPLSLFIVSTIGIILGLGHFYFGYIYHIKKTNFLTTLVPLIAAIGLNYILYKVVFALSFPWNALANYFMAVLFLFTFHHVYDTYRFGYKIQALVWLVYGIGALSITYTGLSFSMVGPFMIWALVYYHYLFWIVISARKMQEERRKKFLKEQFYIHAVVVLFFAVSLQTGHVALTAIFSLAAFHHLTSIHIIFSALKELPFLKQPLISFPRS